MKEQQTQAYQSQFEDLRMGEGKPCDEFYLRLSTVINRAVGIGYALMS